MRSSWPPRKCGGRVLGQPDIDSAPNFDKFVARTKYRKETEKLENSLPDGFPQQLDSKLVWDGNDIKDKYYYTYELNEHEVQEIEEALKHFKCTYWDLSCFLNVRTKHLT